MTKKFFIILILLFVSISSFGQIVDDAWVNRYNGPGNGNDHAYAIVVDGSGNVYVTGLSLGIGTSYDYATVKYYPNGNTGWVSRYNGPRNYVDWAHAIAVDGAGNVYVTGESYGSVAYYDYATIKYYTNGDTAWVRRYNGSGNDYDIAYAIVVDDFGNAYVTGKSWGSGTKYDFATIKYYPDGDTGWVRRYNGPGNGYDEAYAIAIDDSGNIYVTGWSEGSGTGEDYTTIKYYPDGDTAWVRRYNGLGNWSDRAYAIAVDSSGYVYVTGASAQSNQWPITPDYATFKYDSDGNELWAKRYDGPAHSSDYALCIAVDGSGNVYVSGYSWGTGTDYDYATIKYYSNGNTAWIRRYDGRGGSADVANDIAIDGYGSVYVTGYSAQLLLYPYDYDYATIRYYGNGSLAWETKYHWAWNSTDWGSAIALDGSGNVYVTGWSYSTDTQDDYATIKYVQLKFFRGDCNTDGYFNMLDVVLLANYILKGGPPPYPLEAGDVNCDWDFNLVDVILLAQYILWGEPLPC
jgi:uncharacterized delta-60 repeat protein